jgi:hypothetical protein
MEIWVMTTKGLKNVNLPTATPFFSNGTQDQLGLTGNVLATSTAYTLSPQLLFCDRIIHTSDVFHVSDI